MAKIGPKTVAAVAVVAVALGAAAAIVRVNRPPADDD